VMAEAVGTENELARLRAEAHCAQAKVNRWVSQPSISWVRRPGEHKRTGLGICCDFLRC